MKKILIVALIAASAFFGTLFTGKDVNESEYCTPYNLVIILGAHDNALKPDLNELISDDIENAVRTASKITIIVNDGNPYIYDEIAPPEISSDLSKINQERKIKKYARKIMEICDGASARSDEVDVYSSVNLASRIIKTESDRIIMIDSGLSTAGKVSFTEMAIAAVNIDSYVHDIFCNDYSIDLKNAYVEVIGLGEVAGEQKHLSNIDYNRLCMFYESFFSKCTDNLMIVKKPYINPSEYEIEGYSVSSCPVTFEYSSPPESDTDIILEGNIIEVPVEDIGFKPDEATFINNDLAREKMSNLAAILKCTNENICIAGMTATWGEAASSIELSYKRAEACRNLLEECGVDTSAYIVLGTGFERENAFHINDILESGELIEENARQNRKVLIMSEDTAEINGLLKFRHS